MGIREWLGLKNKEQGKSDEAETKTVRDIVSALDELEPERAKFIAGFAYLLGRVANADLDISPAETRAMERLVQEVGQLPEDQAVVVVQMAKTHAKLFGGTEDYLVSREFAQRADSDQKRALLRCLFAVSAADDEISAVEDNTIKQIADELKIDREEVNSMRGMYRDYLASLKAD